MDATTEAAEVAIIPRIGDDVLLDGRVSALRYVQPLGFQLEIARILLWHPYTNGRIIAGLAESPRTISGPPVAMVVTDPAIRLLGLTRGVDRQRIDDIWPVWTGSRSMGGGATRSPGRTGT